MKNLGRTALVLSALALPASVPALAQDGDAAAGERVFRQCMACHAVGDGAKNKIGPQLNEVIGRQPGGLEGYAYSPAMVAYGEGKTWDVGLLDEFLAAPRTVVKGTKMAYPGARNEKQRTDLIAYIASFSTGQ